MLSKNKSDSKDTFQSTDKCYSLDWEPTGPGLTVVPEIKSPKLLKVSNRHTLEL